MKTSRQKVLDIFNRKNTDDKAFWTGHPNDATIPIFARNGVSNRPVRPFTTFLMMTADG